MPRISAVLIVKNEATRIAACLEALRSVADEIVVADTGSTDETVAIARRFTDYCHAIPWEDDFAAARNRAIAFATGDWVLTIDADEVVREPELARERLLAFAAGQPDGATGAIRHFSPTGSGADARDVSGLVERFFRRGAYVYAGIIHEQLTPVSGVRGPLGDTGVSVDHSGYAARDDGPDHKGIRNLPLLERAVADHPDDVYYRYQLGRTLFALKRYGDAVSDFQRALEGVDFSGGAPLDQRGTPVNRETLTTLLTSLAYALVNTGRLGEAEALLGEHIALDHPGTRWADFYHVCGYVALMAGDIERAKAGYAEALRCGAIREDVAGTGSYASAYHLGLLAEAEQDVMGAIGHYATALRLKSDYRVALDRYIDFMVEHQLGVAPNIQANADPETFRVAFLTRLNGRLDKGEMAAADFLVTAAGLLGVTNKRFAGDLLARCQQLRMRYGTG